MKMFAYLAAGACFTLAASTAIAQSEEVTEGYVAATGGIVKTGLDSCLHSGTYSSDAPNNTCEGIEEETVAEAPAVVEAPKPVARIDTGELSELALFDTDSAELNADGRDAMESLFEQVAEYKGITGITVIGHADSRGDEDYNMALSERRAQSVADVLATRYPDARIQVMGKGESEPKASNDTPEGRQMNRRVEIDVTATRMTFE